VSLAYRYRAATPGGDVVEGVLQAPNERQAMDELRRRTLVPVSVELEHERGAARSWVSRDDDLATAIRALASLLAGGASLERGLAFAATHAQHKGVAAALGAVRAEVLGGASLTQAIAAQGEIMGTLAPAMVRAGEESGRLDQALARLADHLEQSRALRAQLRGALLYPALMGFVSALGVVVLLTFVVPRFAAMLSDAGGSLPLSTRLLVAASGAVSGWWWVWLPLLVASMAGLRQWLRTDGGRRRWHSARLDWPVVGSLERQVWSARFTRALGVLLESGSGVLSSLRIASEGVGNVTLRHRLQEAVRAVERGERFSGTVEGALPPLATQLLAIGEESGTLGPMALRVADAAESEVQRRLKALVSLVEPILIVSFGALVGFIALAMLQAIYSINASVL
jgi:type II secretory pathway component PulF